MDISRYEQEINAIVNKLENLEYGKWSELTGNKSDGSFRRYATYIKLSFINLIKKIENDDEGCLERLKKL